jgi:hypothetical protein
MNFQEIIRGPGLVKSAEPDREIGLFIYNPKNIAYKRNKYMRVQDNYVYFLLLSAFPSRSSSFIGAFQYKRSEYNGDDSR